jgi:hypothetical protein
MSKLVLSQARVQVLNETSKAINEGFRLCLQWCRYIYGNGSVETGYRFIWRKPNGHLQPARGQARIPSLAVMSLLMKRAIRQGWGEMVG